MTSHARAPETSIHPTSIPPSRLPAGKRLLGAALLSLAALAGCVNGPARPTTPPYSGAERPEPTRPPRPGEPLPSSTNPFARSRDAYMPRHMEGTARRDIKRVAVMLPFSATDPEVRRLTTGLFNAIQMALFEVNAADVVLIPKDTPTDPAQVSVVAREAMEEGAIAVIGPLFAPHVPVVASEAAGVRAPVLAFSTDVAAIGQGAYLASLTPATEVQRIIDWAAQKGVTRFAMFGPNSAYGRAVESALREQATRRGGLVIAVEYYNPGDSSPQDAARRLAASVRAENRSYPGQVAVLLPERGVQLRTVANLLPYFDVNPNQVQFLGAGGWNDPTVWREPPLVRGAFPAPTPDVLADFDRRYQAMFGEAPPRLASFGYDAGALAATLANQGRLDRATVERTEGFGGVNGLFRFLPDGSVERALAVLQVQPGGTVKVVSPAMTVFTPGS
jgi:ABC-type branched-subunit amino acid transport system substrate-binding protein